MTKQFNSPNWPADADSGRGQSKQSSGPGNRTRKLSLESLESREMFASLPFGAVPADTGEFMLGRIAVTPVLLESNGTIDPSTENWSQSEIQATLSNVQTGLKYWDDLLATKSTVHQLEWVVDQRFAINPVPTAYEPISRISNDYTKWVREFLTGQGYNQTGSLEADMRAFNNAQRQALNADFAFTIFVIDSSNDADGNFAVGGSFTRAFAFAGGLFFATPSTRPASTYAHETGHMFWARDEYSGGGSYFQRRGYYNTQNLNAADNPTPGFVQQPSIMASGTLLQTAYDTLVSPPSTLAQIGWQDSDNDGIFDVLDVPLKLDGTGYWDVASSVYRFKGSASVQAAPNLNSQGLRNDITINKIARIEYRIDTGAWQTALTVNAYTTNLDLSLTVPSGSQSIEIRAVGNITGIESPSFVSNVNQVDIVGLPGINGAVWIDANKNNVWDPGESGQAGWTVKLVNASGQELNLRKKIEPDDYPEGQLNSGFSPLVSLTTVGSDADGRIGAFTDTFVSTGTKGFRGYSTTSQSWQSLWNDQSRRLQAYFAQPTNEVTIDVIGNGATSYGRIDAYNASGTLVARYTSPALNNGQIATLKVNRSENDIQYVIIGGQSATTVRLDNLQFGPQTSTTTGTKGEYRFSYLPADNYNLIATPPANASYSPGSTGGDKRTVTITAGQVVLDTDFRFISNSSAWQNPINRFDVDANGIVSPIDVLVIINDINRNDARSLEDTNFVPPPYLDVTGDKFVSPIDVLQVINFLNANGNSEGENGSPQGGNSGGLGGSNDTGGSGNFGGSGDLDPSGEDPVAPWVSQLYVSTGVAPVATVQQVAVSEEDHQVTLDAWLGRLGADLSASQPADFWHILAQRMPGNRMSGGCACGECMANLLTAEIDNSAD